MPAIFSKLEEIKRTYEVKTIQEKASPIKTIKGLAIGSMGDLYKAANARGVPNTEINIFKIPAGTKKITLSGLSIFTVHSKDDSKEIKFKENRQDWIVAALSSGLEADYSEGSRINLMDNQRISVQKYNEKEKEYLEKVQCSSACPKDCQNCPDLDKCVRENKNKIFVDLEVDERISSNLNIQDTYLFVCTAKLEEGEKLEIEISRKDYDNDIYFEEEPVAEAITSGDTLYKSRIFFGTVINKGKRIENGICIWQNPGKKVYDNGSDYQEYSAIFYKPILKIVDPILLEKERKFFRDCRKYQIFRKKELERKLKKYVPVGKFKLPVPVYEKSDHRFDTYVWSKNLFSNVSVLEPGFDPKYDPYTRINLLQYKSHHLYKDLLESYSVMEVYSNHSEIASKKPEDVAKTIVRNLLRQPRGCRSISFDQGNYILRDFFGGPIRLADNIKMNEVDSNLDENKKNELYAKNKKIREQKDYLYSMVYFGKDDTDSQDKLCGDGYFYYDAPIHLDYPKIKNKPEGIEDEIEKIKLMYRNPNVHKEGHDVNENISSCEAFRNLMEKIFTEVDKYGINIDYVYQDFEKMRNTAQDMRTTHRIELNDTNIAGLSIEVENGDPGDNWLVKLDWLTMWKALWKSITKNDCMEPDAYGKIHQKLMERGFVVLDANRPLGDVAVIGACNYYNYLPYAQESSKERPDYAYIRRRNLNIWENVVVEYTAGLFEKFMMEPIRKYSPNMQCSIHGCDERSALNHISNEFETPLGGSVNLPSKMGSTPNMYGSCSWEIYKKNLYNWKTLPRPTSPFGFIACTINYTRSAIFSNSSKPVMPFISCPHFWTMKSCGATDVDYAKRCHKYYREMLFHSWLCSPQMMYAYIIYGERESFNHAFKLSEDKGSVSEATFTSGEYYRDSYKEIQDIIQEERALLKLLTRNTCKVELKTDTLASETDPFVITGVNIGKKLCLYRFTCDDGFDLDITRRYLRRPLTFRRLRKLPIRIYQDIEFKIHGKTITFNNADFIESPSEFKEQSGFWIVSTSRNAPAVTTDKDYYLKNPSWEIPDFYNANVPNSVDAQKVVKILMEDIETKTDPETNATISEYADLMRMRKPNLLALFGEPAKKQKYFISANFNKFNPDEYFFSNKIDTLTGKKGCEFEASIDLDNLSEKNTCLKGINSTDFSLNLPLNKTGLKSKPIGFIDIYKGTKNEHEKFEKAVKNIHFKSCIDGMNFRVDVFRKSDGVNVTDMDDFYSEEDMKIMRSSTDDTFYLKVSWLNATPRNEKYEVFCVPRGNSIIRLPKLSKLFCHTFNVPAGDEGYRILEYKGLSEQTDCLDVFVNNGKNIERVSTIAFFPKLHRINTIIGKGIGSDGTLHYQQTEMIKTDVFKIPAGTSKITIYGLDVYSVNNDPNNINSQEIKYFYQVDEHGKVKTRDKWIVATLSSSEELDKDENGIEKIRLIPNHRINVDTFKSAESIGKSNSMTIKIDDEIKNQESFLFVSVPRKSIVSVKLIFA